MKLSVAHNGLNYYLRHVVYGEEQREIARRVGVNVSNVCRHVQRIEGLREDPEFPEWGEVLDALEAWLIANHDTFPEAGMSHSAVISAFGTSLDELERTFTGSASPASWRGAIVVSASDAPFATVLHLGKPTGFRFARGQVLAAFALGILLPNGGHKLLRTFKVARDARFEVATAGDIDEPGERVRAAGHEARRARTVDEFPVVKINRRNPELIGAADLRTAQEFALLWQMRGAEMAVIYDRLRDVLAPRLLRVLELVCGQRVGVELAEAEMGLPARSGKLLVSVALESARATGVLR